MRPQANTLPGGMGAASLPSVPSLPFPLTAAVKERLSKGIFIGRYWRTGLQFAPTRRGFPACNATDNLL